MIKIIMISSIIVVCLSLTNFSHGPKSIVLVLIV